MGTVSSRETINRRKIPSLRSQRKSIISDSGISNTIVNPVKLVKHQVVLSDHIPPMSSLSAAISPISWRKSSHSTVSNISTDDDDISPRTSTGSDHHGFLKINTLYDTYSDPNIIFESKYHLNQQQRNERKPTNHQFYHNDEKEYDR